MKKLINQIKYYGIERKFYQFDLLSQTIEVQENITKLQHAIRKDAIHHNDRNQGSIRKAIGNVFISLIMLDIISKERTMVSGTILDFKTHKPNINVSPFYKSCLLIQRVACMQKDYNTHGKVLDSDLYDTIYWLDRIARDYGFNQLECIGDAFEHMKAFENRGLNNAGSN